MPPDFHLFSALLGNCIWVSEGLVKLIWLLWIPAQTHMAATAPPPKIVLWAWLIVLCWAFLSNCEAFSAQPGLWKEQQEAKWKLPDELQLSPYSFCQETQENARHCPFQMRTAELPEHIINPTSLVDSLALITWLRLNIFSGQKKW